MSVRSFLSGGWLYRVASHLKTGAVLRAAAECRVVLQSNPDEQLGRALLGYLLVDRGAIDAGISELRVAVRLDAYDVYARSALAASLYEIGEWEESAVQAVEAVRVDPLNFFSRFVLGRTLRTLGRLDEAMRELQTAVQIRDGHFPAAHYELGCVLLDRGDPNGARQEFLQVIETPGATVPSQSGWVQRRRWETGDQLSRRAAEMLARCQTGNS